MNEEGRSRCLRLLSSQGGDFGPDDVVVSRVEGQEGQNVVRTLLRQVLQPWPSCGLVKGHSRHPPGPGLRDKALQQPRGACQPSFPGGAGLKEALAPLFTTFKGRTVKSWPPNAHIMWEKVLGRK